jgi:hypothetical protein
MSRRNRTVPATLATFVLIVASTFMCVVVKLLRWEALLGREQLFPGGDRTLIPAVRCAR